MRMARYQRENGVTSNFAVDSLCDNRPWFIWIKFGSIYQLSATFLEFFNKLFMVQSTFHQTDLIKIISMNSHNQRRLVDLVFSILFWNFLCIPCRVVRVGFYSPEKKSHFVVSSLIKHFVCLPCMFVINFMRQYTLSFFFLFFWKYRTFYFKTKHHRWSWIIQNEVDYWCDDVRICWHFDNQQCDIFYLLVFPRNRTVSINPVRRVPQWWMF